MIGSSHGWQHPDIIVIVNQHPQTGVTKPQSTDWTEWHLVKRFYMHEVGLQPTYVSLPLTPGCRRCLFPGLI